MNIILTDIMMTVKLNRMFNSIDVLHKKTLRGHFGGLHVTQEVPSNGLQEILWFSYKVVGTQHGHCDTIVTAHSLGICRQKNPHCVLID
jgi:hypothetical protein